MPVYAPPMVQALVAFAFRKRMLRVDPIERNRAHPRGAQDTFWMTVKIGYDAVSSDGWRLIGLFFELPGQRSRPVLFALKYKAEKFVGELRRISKMPNLKRRFSLNLK